MDIQNKEFITSKRIQLPWCAYGTGVIDHYSKKPSLWVKHNVMNVLRSVKHRKVNRQLYININASKIVSDAYSMGIRLFDTGRIYGKSELAIGRALKQIPRKSYFLCTKISDLNLLQKHTPDDVIGNLKISLKYLNVDYVDVLLLHHPHGLWTEMYAEMEKAYNQGLAKAIGVSNFTVSDFKILMKTAKITPMLCQGERHPLFTNADTLNYCRKNDIVFMAHTPTGGRRQEITKSAVFNKLVAIYRKTPAQIIMRWHYQNSIIPVFSSSNVGHIKENLDIFDFSLTDIEMTEIDSLNINLRLLDCLNGVDNPNYIYNL